MCIRNAAVKHIVTIHFSGQSRSASTRKAHELNAVFLHLYTIPIQRRYAGNSLGSV